MRLKLGIVAGVALGLAACGGGDSGPSKGELQEALMEVGGFDDEQAECYVDELYDDLSKADREAIVRRDTDYEIDLDEERAEEVNETCLGAAEQEFSEVGDSIAN